MVTAPSINLSAWSPFPYPPIDPPAFCRSWIAAFGVRTLCGPGDITLCKLLEDDARDDLLVPGDWKVPWEVHRHDEES